MSDAAPSGITAVVVSCGLETLLRFALAHLHRALAGFPARVVVVDNASATPYPTAGFGGDEDVLRFDRHVSFARANNVALARHPNDLHLLVNNDVLLAETAIERAVALLQRTPRAGICGSRLLFPDGTVQHGGVVFGAGRTGPYHRDRGRAGHVVPRRNEELQAVTGACMLVVGRAWRELGGLDDAYPFGLEDVDLCLRARRAGWRVVCCDDVDSLHFESLTPGRARRDRASRRLFLERWRGRYTIDG